MYATIAVILGVLFVGFVAVACFDCLNRLARAIEAQNEHYGIGNGVAPAGADDGLEPIATERIT